jgi:hypothetical protein
MLMPNKIHNLNEDEKRHLSNLIDASSKSICDEEWYNSREYIRKPNENLGLCGTCIHLTLVESDFSIKMAKCRELEFKINLSEPVKKCSDYKRIGSLSLHEMKDIAWLIEIPRIVGFRNKNENNK